MKLLIYFSTCILLCYSNAIKGFDDTILFDINWPGKSLEYPMLTDDEHMIITTSYNEKYKCILPKVNDKDTNSAENYAGPTPLELLAPVFSQSSCSYRLESYWTYEICHNRHIRQYHEDREGKKVKVQEYILGEWSKNQHDTMLDELRSESNKNAPIPYKKVDGINLPYFEINMSNGTLCELNQNKPRETKVIYVCYANGKHEVFSIKEISTCMYEVVILSPLLCAHPKYKVSENAENQISCLPLEDSLTKPRNLMKMSQEQRKLRLKSDLDRIHFEFHQLFDKEEPPKTPEVPLSVSPVKSFLNGEHCLTGGTGWWKYKFCYGKTVEQYHVEKDGKVTTINLGHFNKEKHLNWLKQNSHKRPKPLAQRTHLSHLYTDGSYCEHVKKPRQTEVKLKCVQGPSSGVSLYLLEPRYCEYILGVESPLICDILANADENGLVDTDGEVSSVDEDDKISKAKIEL